MLIAAPDDSLTAYDPTPKFFPERCAARLRGDSHTTSPTGETVAPLDAWNHARERLTVPMLNIPAYKKGDDTKLKVDFTGAMAGARANVFIEPHKNGKETEVTMRFHELKEAPTGQTYILWAVSPDNQFFKLGQIANFKGKNEAEIKAKTSLADFGLLVTMEDFGAVKTVVVPAGPRLGHNSNSAVARTAECRNTKGPYDRRAFLLSHNCYKPRDVCKMRTVVRCICTLLLTKTAAESGMFYHAERLYLSGSGIVLATNLRNTSSFTPRAS